MIVGSSPLTRGKQPAPPRSTGRSGLIPAHAGKTIFVEITPQTGRAHPRSRGENKVEGLVGVADLGSSPLTRGKHQTDRVGVHSRRLIPAHAGKTGRYSPPLAEHWAHPRSRGENAPSGATAVRLRGSSPLTRGKRSSVFNASIRVGLIPAHAGKTPTSAPDRPSARAHPRSRGENHFEYARPENIKGSSPLTRGKRPRKRWATHRHGLIPAHAGKTGGAYSVACSSGAHPRSRGENWGSQVASSEPPGSSPLTRGKPDPESSWPPAYGLIPAHAGKTPPTTPRTSRTRAHPRSRGENIRPESSSTPKKGSSPLTRGKP